MNDFILDNTTYEMVWFKITAFCFLVVFLYYVLKTGFKLGVVKTCVLWAISVVATPIPIGGILISFPLNVFTQFPMAQTQLISSGAALGILWYWPTKTNIFNTLVEKNKYAIYVTCIACSVLISYLINQSYTGNSFDWFLWVGVAVLIGLYGVLLMPR
jgi:hypothetical protein